MIRTRRERRKDEFSRVICRDPKYGSGGSNPRSSKLVRNGAILSLIRTKVKETRKWKNYLKEPK